MKIDLLPETLRPHLYELADIIAGQHRQLQNKKPRNHPANSAKKGTQTRLSP